MKWLYTKIIGKECRNPECENFRRIMPKESSVLCMECDLPMSVVRKISYPKVFFPPFLALVLFVFSLIPDITFLGLPIKTNGFIIILDISGSMSEAIQVARQEAKTILDKHRKKWWFFWRYADVIFFDQHAHSALGSIGKLDETVVSQLQNSLEQTWSGGGTCLQSAIELAASEVVAYGKPTTLLILTDGADRSIPFMIQNSGLFKEMFQDIEVHAHTTTPRIILSNSPIHFPMNLEEQNLRRFSNMLDGDFGATIETTGCGALKTIAR